MVKIKETDAINDDSEDTYQPIFSLTNTSKFKDVTFLTSNQGSKGLTYKVTVYAHEDGVEYTLYEEDILTFVTIEKVFIDNTYDKIVIYVKSKVGSNPTNFNVNYIAQYKDNFPN